MDNMISPISFVQQTVQQEDSSNDFQTPPLTFSRSSSSLSFTSRAARYNNDDYSQVLQFKIQLKYIRKPIIWRRIQVPYDYTFFHFHLAIQCCMGWLDCHLHSFRAEEGFEFGDPHTYEDFPDMPQVREEKTHLLREYFRVKGQQMEYDYDFGDSWRHIITYEGVFDRKRRTQYPKCLNGKGKCPPEDAGGCDGFENFKKIMSNKNHPEYEEFYEWHGGDYNPYEFDRNSAFNDLEHMTDFRDMIDDA